MLSPHCTDVIPPLYWRYPVCPHCTEYPPQYWCYPLHVLMLSPQCTEYPPQYWSYPPTVLMLSPTVLSNLHSTEGIPPQYWSYPPTCTAVIPHGAEGIPPQYWIPSTVLMLGPHGTDVIPPHVLMLSPHCTEPPLQYWSYPPHGAEAIPPLYWTASAVLKLSPHSTEAIPSRYWCYPPMYWAASNVLNNLHSTEPTLCGVRLSQEWVSGSRVVHDCLTEDWEKPSKGGDYLFLPRVSHNRARLKIDDKRMKI